MSCISVFDYGAMDQGCVYAIQCQHLETVGFIKATVFLLSDRYQLCGNLHIFFMAFQAESCYVPPLHIGT
jgi:hypothetical protein